MDLSDYDFGRYGNSFVKLQQECIANNAASCLELGNTLKNRSNPIDTAAASIVYDNGCTHDSAESCLQLGLLQDQGSFSAGYYTGYTALDHYQKACDLKLIFGCHRAAFAARRDKESSSEFLKKACAMGDKTACSGTIRTFDASMSPAERCQFGDGKTCAEISQKKTDEHEASMTGSNNGGVVDIQNWTVLGQYWTLQQIVNGYAVFHFIEPIYRRDYLVAIKRSSLGTLVPGQSIVYATRCLRFLGDQQWDNAQGFPMKVRTYQAVACPAK